MTEPKPSQEQPPAIIPTAPTSPPKQSLRTKSFSEFVVLTNALIPHPRYTVQADLYNFWKIHHEAYIKLKSDEERRVFHASNCCYLIETILSSLLSNMEKANYSNQNLLSYFSIISSSFIDFARALKKLPTNGIQSKNVEFDNIGRKLAEADNKFAEGIKGFQEYIAEIIIPDMQNMSASYAKMVDMFRGDKDKMIMV